jgi:polyribonucleotide nucleotidyltransferase
MGRGGEMVRYIQESYQCEIDVTEEGVAYVYGQNKDSVTEAAILIKVLL